MVAEIEGELVGFLGGFRAPDTRTTLFVWQVAVAESWRKQGLAAALLDQVLAQEENADLRWVEATVAESNRASRRFFSGFADRHRAKIQELACFSADHLAAAPGHEPEPLLRIGPRRQGK